MTVRYAPLLLITLFFLCACGNNKANQPISENDTAETFYYWESTLNDSTGNLEMKKIETTDSLSVPSILDYINKDNPRLRLEWVKTSNDTVYIKIKDATVLTQQMGSTGATEYMAAVVYNLTELRGMKYVNFDFQEGDHAAPGTFSRESFKNE